jgi:hypothetical protein
VVSTVFCIPINLPPLHILFAKCPAQIKWAMIFMVFRMDKLKFFSLPLSLCTMVKSRWYNGTMMKTRRHDGETTMARWWKHEGTMVKTQCNIVVSSSYYPGFTIMPSLFDHRTIVVSSSYHRCFIIVPSPSGEAYAILLLFYFINKRAQHTVIYVINSNKILTRQVRRLSGSLIVPSWFHHRAFAFSSSYHRDFTIVPSCIKVKGEKKI